MISRISFIFSFFWAHEVPILPLTLFFENRLDWIESLWLLFLSRALLSLDISPAGRRRTPQRNQQRHRSSNPCRGLQRRSSGASCSACAAGGRRPAACLQEAGPSCLQGSTGGEISRRQRCVREKRAREKEKQERFNPIGNDSRKRGHGRRERGRERRTREKQRPDGWIWVMGKMGRLDAQ